MIETHLMNSLISIKPESRIEEDDLKFCYMCNNQPFSFQMAFKITDNSKKDIPFFVRIISELDISYYYVGCVPVLHTDCNGLDYVEPIGLYPDVLMPKKVNPKIVCMEACREKLNFEKSENTMLTAYNDSWQSLWFVINEKAKKVKSGKYNIRIELFDTYYQFMGSSEMSVDVIGISLPQQKLMYTNWFHHDCLADFYNVDMFSDRYFEIMTDYVEKAARNGMNMILLPAFTPPLDTPVGEERMTVQLLKIKVNGMHYEFDFSLMKRFIDICRKNGIKYFEHSHFFTQWGAKKAPKIIAEVNGKKKQIFGWNTKAVSKKYISFLQEYIKELKVFLKNEKLDKKILFHISDEPNEDNVEYYASAQKSIKNMLKGYMVGDALSNIEYYEKGYCETPIASITHIHDFIGKCDNLWAYYIGCDCKKGMSNRLLQISRERNRMLGVQLYYYNIKGFLQWGYNNYYGPVSQYRFNPLMNPCGGFASAGTSYMVYPSNDGKAYQSVRQKIFAEGLTDIRALQLLEHLVGRKACEEIIVKHLGVPHFEKSPDNPNTYISFISEVYKEIKINSDEKTK